METIPKGSALVVVPLEALSGIGQSGERKSIWERLLDSDLLKVLGAGLAAAVAALWTLHLYMDDAWKESATAITAVSRSIDEISFFCSGDKNTIGVEEFKKLLVIRESGRKPDGKPADSNMPANKGTSDDLTAGLCAKAVFEARQSLAVGRTRIVQPFLVSDDTWVKAWEGVTREMGVITSFGIGNGGQRLKALEDAWRELKTLMGL